MKKIFIYVLIIILSLFIGIYGTIIFYNNNTKEVENNVNITETNSLTESINKIYDAVVLVENYKNGSLIASGTGFIYKKEDKGYVITNRHVIADNSYVKVVLSTGEEIEATVLGSDIYADIAVLSIDKDYVKQVAIIGNSMDLKLGDTLFTVGSPLGKDYMGTITKGILSGKDRTITVELSNGSFVMDVLQTDAAINEGNSGGPLCNINGEVIGINSLKIVADSAEGMGFAIPIELVMSTVSKLELGETIKRPTIGVSLSNISNYALYKYNITIPSTIDEGALIVNVKSNSAAARAGLESGDVITNIDNIEIKNTAYFRYALYKYNVGDEITITYNRNGSINSTILKITDALEG